jgi:D-alanine-D-alanine ligase
MSNDTNEPTDINKQPYNNDNNYGHNHNHTDSNGNGNGNGNNNGNGNGNGNGVNNPAENRPIEGLTIGIIHSDVKREYFPTEEQYITEKDAETDAAMIAQYISKLGANPILYPGNEYLVENLRKDDPAMVFNLVDSVKGNEYLSSTIPGLLDMLDIPYTGAGILGLALTYNKFLVKKLFAQVGVPVPNFQLFTSASDPIDPNLRFPLISKLNEIHGAVEIDDKAVSENEKDLRERLKFLISTYEQPVLVEEFIVGREICCYQLEGLNRKIYLAEKMFNKPDDKFVFATFNDQWVDNPDDRSQWAYTYQKFEDQHLKDLVRKAFEVTRMADYGKFDVRMDQSGRYYFVDANANPAFGPRETFTAMGLIITEQYGVPFADIIKRLVNNTLYMDTGQPNQPQANQTQSN